MGIFAAIMGAMTARAPRARHAGRSESAAIQRHTREVHAQERAQDYVETIADLIDGCGGARATDIARRLGVSHVTVVRMVQRLQREGLVRSQPRRCVLLTAAGRRLAAKARERHEVVVAFLRALGVPEATARKDAEGIEHHVSPRTLRAFRSFLKSLPSPPA
jgi:DtxR family transcriptional regulator, manganese transport regulator